MHCGDTGQVIFRHILQSTFPPCWKRALFPLAFAFFSQLRATMSATVQVLSMVCVRRWTFVSVALDT